jgi:hypothetical protein
VDPDCDDDDDDIDMLEGRWGFLCQDRGEFFMKVFLNCFVSTFDRWTS